mgnify:CR=1 FL=1
MASFALNPHSGVPIYRQIQDQIRYAIAAGRLNPGEQLPTVRALAVDLSVNPNTVIRAYTELEREGVVTTEQGTGTFVAPQKTSIPESQRKAKLEALCLEFLAHAGAHGFTARAVEQTIRQLAQRS